MRAGSDGKMVGIVPAASRRMKLVENADVTHSGGYEATLRALMLS